MASLMLKWLVSNHICQWNKRTLHGMYCLSFFFHTDNPTFQQQRKTQQKPKQKKTQKQKQKQKTNCKQKSPQSIYKRNVMKDSW